MLVYINIYVTIQFQNPQTIGGLDKNVAVEAEKFGQSFCRIRFQGK
jgi:hypothetical protein